MTNSDYPPPPPYQGPPDGPLGTARVAPPGSVNGAFYIYLLAAVLAAVSIILALTSNVWDQAIAGGAANNSGTNVQSLVNFAKIFTVVVGAIFIALYLLFAFKMRAGRNWARIVLTVVSALSVLSAFSASATVTVDGQVYTSSSTQISGWITAVIAIVAIVLMYLSASNAYFNAAKGRRRSRPA